MNNLNSFRHTGDYLRKQTLGILNSFEIPAKNIVCCVTDNATNMVKMVSGLNDDLEKSNSFPFGDNSDDSEDSEDDEFDDYEGRVCFVI